MNQKDNRSELQQRLDAELRAKAAARNKSESEHPDGVDDSAYIENTRQSSPLAMAWVAIIFFAIGLVALFIYQASRG